jgi:hypothetical protein
MSASQQPKDISHLRARRRDARRRRLVARVDVGLGLLGALVLVLATPGLAITAIVAFLVLALCALSIVLEKRRERRSAPDGPRRRAAHEGPPPTGSAVEVRRVSARRPEQVARASAEGRHALAPDRSAAPPSRARAGRRRS